MSKNDVNIGASPDDGNGDPLRTAFNKLNNTLAEVYSGLGDGSDLSLSLTSNGILNVTTKVTSTATVTDDDATTLTTKGYVDSQFNTADTLPEVLTRGNTTGGSDIAVSANDDITFTDSSEAIFGTEADLKIYHNGTNAKIVNSTGDLNISGGNVNISGGNLAAPTFLGDLNGTINTATTGVTQNAGTNDTTIATTAYADAAAAAVPIADYLPLAGGTMTGNLLGTNAAFSAKLAVGTGAIPNETMLITSGSSTSFKLNRTGVNAGDIIFETGLDHNAIYSRGADVFVPPYDSPKDLRFIVGISTKMTLSSTGTDISSPLTADAATFSGALTGTSGTFSGTVAFNSLKDTEENITVTKFVDKADGLINNDNDTTIPTSAAVVDYVTTTPGITNYKVIGLAMDYMSRVHNDGGVVEGMEQVMKNTEKLILA